LTRSRAIRRAQNPENRGKPRISRRAGGRTHPSLSQNLSLVSLAATAFPQFTPSAKLSVDSFLAQGLAANRVAQSARPGLCLLRHNSTQLTESRPTFQRNALRAASFPQYLSDRAESSRTTGALQGGH
jgi:hypothetical protein